MKTAIKFKELISKNDLSIRWKCHPQTVAYRARTEQLSFIKVGRQRMYLLDSVIAAERNKPIRKYTMKSTIRRGRKPKSRWIRFKELVLRFIK